MGPTVCITYLQGSLYALVIFASPVSHPCRLRHSASNSLPAARWMAPSTPPPPRRDLFAAFTIATTVVIFVMSPWVVRMREVPWVMGDPFLITGWCANKLHIRICRMPSSQSVARISRILYCFLYSILHTSGLVYSVIKGASCIV